MTFEKTAPDRDPCHACPHLETRPPLAPWCARNARYGQVGCVRLARRHPEPPRQARPDPRTRP